MHEPALGVEPQPEEDPFWTEEDQDEEADPPPAEEQLDDAIIALGYD